MTSKTTKAKSVEKSQHDVELKNVETVIEVKQVQKSGKKSTKQVELVIEDKQAQAQSQPESVQISVSESKQSHKGGKKSTKQIELVSTKKSKSVPEPVPEPVQVQVVESKQSQKGGKKSSKHVEEVQEQVAEQVVVSVPIVETKQSQKGKKKSTKQLEPQSEPEPISKQTQKGGKKSTKNSEPIVDEVKPHLQKIEVEAIDDESNEQYGGKLRFFKLFYNDEYQGRYCGRKPKQAANKAFSSIIKEMKKNGNQKGGADIDINFSIRECTRNSRHKEYKYIGVREKLLEPVDVKIKNEDGSEKKITYSFHNKISKAPKGHV